MQHVEFDIYIFVNLFTTKMPDVVDNFLFQVHRLALLGPKTFHISPFYMSYANAHYQTKLYKLSFFNIK